MAAISVKKVYCIIIMETFSCGLCFPFVVFSKGHNCTLMTNILNIRTIQGLCSWLTSVRCKTTDNILSFSAFFSGNYWCCAWLRPRLRTFKQTSWLSRQVSIYQWYYNRSVTTASLKWRLDAWDIQELSLLTASSKMKTEHSHGWQIRKTQPIEPSHSKRNRQLSHCWNNGKGVGGELPGQWAATTKIPEKRLLSVHYNTIHKNVDVGHMRICVNTNDYLRNERALCC